MSHLPRPVMGSTGGSVAWGESKFDRLCRNYNERTGKLRNRSCDFYRSLNSMNGPCPFVHPGDARWVMLGGGLSDPPPPLPPSAPMNPASSTIYSTSSQSSSNRPPQPQERPPPPPRLNTQVPSASGPSTISPVSQSSSGIADPRRRPSIANPTAGPEANYDLTKIPALLQDPNFVAALKTVVGTSNTGSQSPTIPVPPPAATTRGAPNQPPPQGPSQPPGPASAPLKSEPWANTAAASKSRGRQSPQRRQSQDWRSVGTSGGDPWGSRPGPSTDASWTKVSSAAPPPSDTWAYGASRDWNAVAPTTAVWETRHTETPVYTWSIPAAPPQEKPDPEPRPAITAPLRTLPPPGPGTLRGNVEGHPALSGAPLPAQHVPQEIPANKEPPRKLGNLTSTTTSSVQPHKSASVSQKAVPPKPASVDEQPPSPDKLYDYSKSEDDPESTAWRAIIKELGSIYRDHVSYQELEKQRGELEALAERVAARSNPKPEANTGQGHTGPYSEKIKDLKQQMHSLSLSMEKKADEWAAAPTVGQSTVSGSTQSREAAILRDRRSRSFWPFEPPEGRYIPKEQPDADAVLDSESVKNQIQQMIETLNKARSDLDRIQEDLAEEMEAFASQSAAADQAAKPSTITQSSDERETSDESLDSDPSEELRHLASEVDRLSHDVDFIVRERHSMWEDAHSTLGLDIPDEEEGEGETGRPDPQGPDPQISEERDVDPEIDGDEMNVDGGTEGTTRGGTEDRASAAPQPQGDETPPTSALEEMELKVSGSEELLNATALQTGPLVTSINNLVMENMCGADIALLAASNEDLKARMLVLEEQGRAEDVLLQQLYAAVMALDTSAQPDIDQLIDGIVNPVVNEIEAYIRGEFAQKARGQDEAWQAIGSHLDQLMSPTVLVLRAILDKADGLPPQNGHPNGATSH